LRVLIVGGGTGGHVIPALAIADELRGPYGAEVRFLGTERGFETRLVPAAGYQLELIRVGQLKGVSLGTRLRTLLDLPLGILRCFEILKSFRPDAVVGVGGYASGPGMVAAILKRIPTLAFEPNAAPGLANRLVGKRVSAAAVSFAPACAYFHGAKVTGIPVRKEFFGLQPRPASGPPHLLVFGGSQGARVFNTVMPRIVSALLESVPALTILHQAGARHTETTLTAYQASGADPARWQVQAFLDDMPRRFESADLVLARKRSEHRGGVMRGREAGAAGAVSAGY
jgi:UDP-N-acetylglucosamine--N-acetylmuramyl-(pentapeptide) pyrophosphoryl-undecaprenol N-acetylglucosamine transferase